MSREDGWVGLCATSTGFLAEVPGQVLLAIGVAWWTWNKSRIALKSHDDGEGRLVLLPAYQVIPYNSLSQHDA
jgi:hypothetical protein